MKIDRPVTILAGKEVYDLGSGGWVMLAKNTKGTAISVTSGVYRVQVPTTKGTREFMVDWKAIK